MTASNAGIAIDRLSGAPVYRQIYLRVREAVASGALRPGERLPSARSLAAQLGLARGTVDAAYAQLAGEGYVVTQGPAGTSISAGLLPEAAAKERGTRTAPANPARAYPVVPAHPHAVRPFQMGLPALDAFPRKLWARLAARQARAFGAWDMTVRDPAGDAGLRAAIVGYLGVARGIVCTAGQVFVTSGYQGALDLVCRVMLQPGDEVWFEDPGYFMARDALAAAGARLVPVPVDSEGLRVEDGRRRAPAARFAVVTPAHQSPLGVGLSLPRRLALLAWARSADAWVVEDDYDSEFRYVGRPLPALKSLDRAGGPGEERVLYAGTFGKVLFPGLRLGYLVVPESLADRFHEAVRLALPGHGAIEQATVAAFITEGHFARHLKRMRGLYAARRATLADALHVAFDQRLDVALQAGGMHLLAPLPEGVDDVTLVARAGQAGLAPSALSDAYAARRGPSGFLLGFTNIPPEQAPAVARALREAVGPL